MYYSLISEAESKRRVSEQGFEVYLRHLENLCNQYNTTYVLTSSSRYEL